MDANQMRENRLEAVLAGPSNATDLYEPVQKTYTVNNNYGSLSISNPITVTATGQNFSNAIYTTGTTAPWLQHNPVGARIQLDGDDADITVRGWSLVDAVKRIEERLGLYQPNPELEAEWEDLRALGEQYRQLEQHIKDKQSTFNRLKAMPTPDVD